MCRTLPDRASAQRKSNDFRLSLCAAFCCGLLLLAALKGQEKGNVSGSSPRPRRIGIEEVLTRPARALAKCICERFIGSARRECFEHVIVFNEAGLLRLMTQYCSYHERSRTHLSLDKDTPIPRPVTPPGDGAVVAIPEVGGLHHRYERHAA